MATKKPAETKATSLPVELIEFDATNYDCRHLGILSGTLRASEPLQEGQEPNSKHYTIEFLPSIRHYRVTLREPRGKTKVGIICCSQVRCGGLA